jgi:hypothetical protein
MSDIKPKKMVSRNIAVALGIICIILVIVSLVAAFAYYTPIINSQDNTISSLNSQIASLNTQVSAQNSTISSLNTQLAMLQNLMNNLHIWSTENSTVWVDNASSGLLARTLEDWSFSNVSSFGYVCVLASSDSNTTIVRLTLDSVEWNGTVLVYETTVGLGGIAIFLHLPCAWTTIEVGPFNETAIVTATVIYYY